MRWSFPAIPCSLSLVADEPCNGGQQKQPLMRPKRTQPDERLPNFHQDLVASVVHEGRRLPSKLEACKLARNSLIVILQLVSLSFPLCPFQNVVSEPSNYLHRTFYSLCFSHTFEACAGCRSKVCPDGIDLQAFFSCIVRSCQSTAIRSLRAIHNSACSCGGIVSHLFSIFASVGLLTACCWLRRWSAPEPDACCDCCEA